MQQNKDGSFKSWLDGKDYPSFRGFLNSLRKHGFTVKDYYDSFLLENYNELYCENCGKEVNFDTIIKGYKRTCSDTCFNKLPEKREKVSKRFVNNEEKRENFAEKFRKTMSSKSKEELENYHSKIVNTKKEKYGDNHFSEKAKLQWSEKTDEEKREITSKILETKKLNGTLNSNNIDRFKKKKFTYKNKEYCFQGYEDAVIKFLVDNNYEVKTGKEVPKIPYNRNKTGQYTPDIFVEELNLIIEVKSDFTLFVYLNDNIEKQKCTFNEGYYHLIVSISKTENSVQPRNLLEEDKDQLKKFLNKVILSQASNEEGAETIPLREYGAIAIGTGSAGHPKYYYKG